MYQNWKDHYKTYQEPYKIEKNKDKYCRNNWVNKKTKEKNNISSLKQPKKMVKIQ